MARVKDLWHTMVTTTDEDGKKTTCKRKTARHPDNGGNKNAKRWLAVWIDPDGDEKTRAFAKQDAAKNYGNKMEADAERGEYIDRKAGKEKFGVIAEKFLRLRDVGGTSQEKYESTYRNQVKGVFEHRSVKGIKPSEILEWLRSAAMSKMSTSVQSTAFMIVAGALDLAVADGLIKFNPARAKIIKPPKAESSPRPSWDTHTVWAVHDEHPEPYRAIPACEAGLGLRQGEVLAIAEEDFDFAAGKVHVRRQLTRAGGQWVFKLPKEDRERWVPLSRGMAAIAEAHIKTYPPVPYELPWMDEHGDLAREPHMCKLLFRWHGDHPKTRDKHIPASAFNLGVWKPALAAAGVIPPKPEGMTATRYFERGCGGNGTHVLRKFFSVMLQDAAVSPVGVMEFMGHSRKALPVTFRVYGDVTEETFEQARVAVDKTLFRLRPVVSDGTVTELRRAQ
jgi:integrase